MTTSKEYYHLKGCLPQQNVSFSSVNLLDVCKRKRRVNWKQWYGDSLLLLLFWFMFFVVVVRLYRHHGYRINFRPHGWCTDWCTNFGIDIWKDDVIGSLCCYSSFFTPNAFQSHILLMDRLIIDFGMVFVLPFKSRFLTPEKYHRKIDYWSVLKHPWCHWSVCQHPWCMGTRTLRCVLFWVETNHLVHTTGVGSIW